MQAHVLFPPQAPVAVGFPAPPQLGSNRGTEGSCVRNTTCATSDCMANRDSGHYAVPMSLQRVRHSGERLETSKDTPRWEQSLRCTIAPRGRHLHGQLFVNTERGKRMVRLRLCEHPFPQSHPAKNQLMDLYNCQKQNKKQNKHI